MTDELADYLLYLPEKDFVEIVLHLARSNKAWNEQKRQKQRALMGGAPPPPPPPSESVLVPPPLSTSR